MLVKQDFFSVLVTFFRKFRPFVLQNKRHATDNFQKDENLFLKGKFERSTQNTVFNH